MLNSRFSKVSAEKNKKKKKFRALDIRKGQKNEKKTGKKKTEKKDNFLVIFLNFFFFFQNDPK